MSLHIYRQTTTFVVVSKAVPRCVNVNKSLFIIYEMKVLSHLFIIFLLQNTKEDLFKNVGNQTILASLDFHCLDTNIFFCVPERKESEVLNDMRVNKLFFIFGWTFFLGDLHIFARNLPSLNFLCVFVKLPGHPSAKVAVRQRVVDIEDVIFLKREVELGLSNSVIKCSVGKN